MTNTTKKLLSSTLQKRNSAKAAQQLDRKKIFALAIFSFLMLILVSEGVRLAFLSW
jgi:hypothetical protein